jgi:signal transduction histidine kinase
VRRAVNRRAEGVFEPFVTTKPDGLGMGLSICRTILYRHRGEVGASNNPDGGATFTLTLPVSPTPRSRFASAGTVAVR